jgi:hypothetical protein
VFSLRRLPWVAMAGSPGFPVVMTAPRSAAQSSESPRSQARHRLSTLSREGLLAKARQADRPRRQTAFDLSRLGRLGQERLADGNQRSNQDASATYRRSNAPFVDYGVRTYSAIPVGPATWPANYRSRRATPSIGTPPSGATTSSSRADHSFCGSRLEENAATQPALMSGRPEGLSGHQQVPCVCGGAADGASLSSSCSSWRHSLRARQRPRDGATQAASVRIVEPMPAPLPSASLPPRQCVASAARRCWTPGSDNRSAHRRKQGCGGRRDQVQLWVRARWRQERRSLTARQDHIQGAHPEGKIIAEVTLAERRGMLEQLGLIPAIAGAAR